MRSLLLASAAALVLCQAASAQTPNVSGNSNNGAATHTAAPANNGNLRTDIRDMLDKAGYSDVHVMPSSFVIRAKDKTGNPVMMTISPDSFTQVTELDNADASNTALQRTENSGSGTFVSIPASDELSSNLVGLDVYNRDNKDIGKIQDIAMSPRGRAQSYILSVGGFLGMGEHYVAVNPSAVTVTYNNSDKKWHATMNATADQFKAAPEFKYTGRWNASRS